MNLFTNFNKSKNYIDNVSYVTFDRKELGIILKIYGTMVAAGEWRDYGISMLKDVSIFSIYKHSSECPIYMIEKNPRFSKKQGMYSIIALDGRILKRGHDLSKVVKIFNPKLLRLVK
tara:strand:- start:226 stop:576 length:351 start_codon:yes stop_codon:yes gene_type:complete